MARFAFWVFGPVLGVVLVGCTTDTRGSASADVSPADASVTPTDTISPVPKRTDDVDIGVRLHDQKLLAIPAVRTSMRRHVRMYQEGQMSRAEAMARFRAWIELWVADHPDATDLAAQASRPPPFVEPAPGTAKDPIPKRWSGPQVW